jgi:hypothetical protein
MQPRSIGLGLLKVNQEQSCSSLERSRARRHAISLVNQHLRDTRRLNEVIDSISLLCTCTCMYPVQVHVQSTRMFT